MEYLYLKMNWFIELESGVFYIEISFFIYFNTTNSKVLIVRESKKMNT